MHNTAKKSRTNGFVFAVRLSLISLAASIGLLLAAGPARADVPASEANQAEAPASGDVSSAPVDLSADTYPRATADSPVEVPAADALAAPARVITAPPRATANPETNRAASDLWTRLRAGFAMANLESPLVTERENWYARHPAQIRIMVERSSRYLFHIVEELEKRGMPTELALLPMIESAFNPMAYSRAHASGLWQFIPSTGKNYNLTQNWWYDARRDVVASTTAALDYLQVIYEMHGDWHLALASYNWGEHAVARAVERNKRLGLPTDYSNLPMPRETRYYVPAFQAVKNIIANPANFGIELESIANAPYFATVTLTRDIDIKVAARLAGMPVEELVALNAGHNRPMMSSAQAPNLVLPAHRLEPFLANVGAYDQPLSNWRTYDAKRGERIDAIAHAHGIAPEQLRRVNGVRGLGRLSQDVELLVPVNPAAVELPGHLLALPATIATEIDRVAVRHAIRAGDTWSGVARRYGVGVNDLMAWNSGAAMAAGRQLTVFVPAGGRPQAQAGTVAVRATAPSARTPARAQAKPPVRVVRTAVPPNRTPANAQNPATRS